MINKFRFHILGLPHTITNNEYSACAYTAKVLKFGKMMKALGHEVIHYGHEDSELICDEHVTVITKSDIEKAYGDYNWKKNFFKFDMNDHAYQTFYKNTIREIEKRKQKYDFLLPFFGYGHKPVCDAHSDLIVVEPGIGYATGQYAKWRVYESYSIRSAVIGVDAVAQCHEDWYSVVIPNYFDSNDFLYAPEEKEDYFLCLGRVYEGKGVHGAIQICEKLDKILVIAGQGSLEEMGYREIPNKIEYVGYANAEMRKKLMSKAKASFCLSQFAEPFCGVSVENFFSGTPVISTDWGALAENNLHGITGYRVRTFDQLRWAVENIDKINPTKCRQWAMDNFTLEKVGKMYEEYFTMIMDVYTGNGFYQEHPERKDLDWLNRTYPIGII
jgi:glycosyltransferase involved in cell wall biosynthesis